MSDTAPVLKKMRAESEINDAVVQSTENTMEEANTVDVMRRTDSAVPFVHFKFAHHGKIRRFALARTEANLFMTVKHRVEKIMDKRAVVLKWRDEDSLIVLECNDDLSAAMDYYERLTNPTCILLEVAVEEEDSEDEDEDEEADSVSIAVQVLEDDLQKLQLQPTGEINAAAQATEQAPVVNDIAIEQKWPSDAWQAYKNGQPASVEFMMTRQEFMERIDDVLKIPAHLEHEILQEIYKHCWQEGLLNRLDLFYCLVSNNIRLHIYQQHKILFTDNKEVENEFIRLIATDLAKRLNRTRKSVAAANPRIRLRMLWARIRQLSTQVEQEERTHTMTKALNLRGILCNSTYTIAYDPSEAGFQQAHRDVSEFAVQLRLQATSRAESKTATGQSLKENMTEDQKKMLADLFEIRLSDDYELMVAVCMVAKNLEQAVEIISAEPQYSVTECCSPNFPTLPYAAPHVVPYAAHYAP